jgi:hypothetical protein
MNRRDRQREFRELDRRLQRFQTEHPILAFLLELGIALVLFGIALVIEHLLRWTSNSLALGTALFLVGLPWVVKWVLR